MGSTAATGAFNSSSSVTANLEVVSKVGALRSRGVGAHDPGRKKRRPCNDTLRVNGALAPEASLPFLRSSARCWSRSPSGRRARPWAGRSATPLRRGPPRCSWIRTIRTAWPSWWCCRAAACRSTASSSS